MKITCTISLAIYETKISISFVDKTFEFEKYIKKKYKHDIGDMSDSYGFVWNNEINMYHVCFIIPGLNHNTIAHEVFHLAEAVCRDRNIEDEETKAWLIGFITEHVYKTIKEK